MNDPEQTPDAPRTRAGMTRRQWIALAVLVPVIAVGAYVGGRVLTEDDVRPGIQLDDADGAEAFDWDYLIPAGTAARIQAGEDVEIVPADLTVRVGDVIRIVNEDSADHIVGIFFVGAGETLTQRFKTEGVLQGECSVHPSGSFTLNVLG